MENNLFCTTADDLPETLAIMPLKRVVLLPGGRLPLNMFETRYTTMVNDCLPWPRLMGIIQPYGMQEDDECESPHGNHPLYQIGCAGRIIEFGEADRQRFQIVLEGVCRFRIDRELEPDATGYRRIIPDWQPYKADLGDVSAEDSRPQRKKLLALLQAYFKLHQLNADWSMLNVVPTPQLLASLVMACPFAIAEKQALLETGSIAERAELLISLIEMELLEKERSMATLN